MKLPLDYDTLATTLGDYNSFITASFDFLSKNRRIDFWMSRMEFYDDPCDTCYKHLYFSNGDFISLEISRAVMNNSLSQCFNSRSSSATTSF